MRLGYSITFEFENAQPRTHRGVIEARGTLLTAARLALKEARRAVGAVAWSSLVMVLEKTAAERFERPLDDGPLDSSAV